MSASSMPAPIKILCLLGLGLLIWLGSGADKGNEKTDGSGNQIAVVEPAPTLAGDPASNLHRDSQALETGESATPPTFSPHQTPVAHAIYQNVSGQPISGATVELWPFNQMGMGIVNSLPQLNAPEFSTTTNDLGEFELPFARLSSRRPQLGLIANGDEYILLFRHDDYADLREMSLTNFNSETVITAPQQLELFRGQVLLHDNSPAAVTGVFVDSVVKTWTDAGGNFTVGLRRGSHELGFVHELGATSKVVIAGEQEKDIIVLPRAQNISGVTLDLNNQPLANIELEAVRTSATESSGRATSRATSDKQGRFVFHGLADGIFHLRSVRPQREYWPQGIEAGAKDVQLRIDDRVFSFDVAGAPQYAVWNTLVVRVLHNGNYRTLVSESKSSLLRQSYDYFLSNDIKADQLIMDFQVAGYKPLHFSFDVGPSAARQQQSTTLVTEAQSAALHLTFFMPQGVKPFGLNYVLQRVDDGRVVTQHRRSVSTPGNERREYYYPHLLAGDYKVQLQLESNSFFSLPEISIAGNAIIKIEPDENNFIELDLVAN